MKLAFVTLMSCCLIAVSWQQHYRQQHHQQANVNPYWPLPLHQHRQQLPYYYQEPHQNYPSYYPYYRGPYSPAAAQSYANYYQPYQQQQQTPQRSELDELKLAALLSQLGQQQQQENEKQESKQKQLDLDLLNQLNKDSVFIAQHQDLDPFADPEAVKQVFSVTVFNLNLLNHWLYNKFLLLIVSKRILMNRRLRIPKRKTLAQVHKILLSSRRQWFPLAK